MANIANLMAPASTNCLIRELDSCTLCGWPDIIYLRFILIKCTAKEKECNAPRPAMPSKAAGKVSNVVLTFLSVVLLTKFRKGVFGLPDYKSNRVVVEP